VSADDEDVKTLLGRALAGEPPLTLDRDAVFRQGRRKLRNRRRFEAGGAIAGVVAAAVGAVLLTGLVAEEPAEDLPPAASREPAHPPPGPTLPLTTTTTVAEPPSSAPSSVTLPRPMSKDHAAELTTLLAKSVTLGGNLKLTTLGGDGEAVFEINSDLYYLQADVRTPTSEGSLFISLAAGSPTVEADCGQLEQVADTCAVEVKGGLRVAVGFWKYHDTGEKRYAVTVNRPDGTSITAISTNQSERQRRDGKLPRGGPPVVDRDDLVELVLIPGLRFRG
jgi:hypothetical protein